MRRLRGVAALLACVVIAAVAIACQPTGDIRCDRHAGILMEIEAHGWSTDCTPDFTNQHDGRTIRGLASVPRKTVYIWPDAMNGSDGSLRKVMWHELAHVRGIYDELDAEVYSWCREPIIGVGYFISSPDAWPPTAADCERVGAR